MKLPKIIFSKWVHWGDRNKLENNKYPGVYILAKFKKIPSGKANPLEKNIIYIGETCNNTLKGRLYQFNRSAFDEKFAHSGGKTYREIYKDKGKDLYVAYLHVKDNNIRHLFIRYVERKLIYDYAKKHGQQPKCNSK